MPRAVDLRQPAADYDPTRSGTEFHLQSFQQIDDLIAQILAGALESFTNLIIPAIEEFTGLDLSAVKPLLDELDLDFTSPAAFLTSMVNALAALPEVLVALLASLIPWFDIEGAGFLNGALDGINLEPGAALRMIRQMISDALEDIPLLGEITQPLTGLVGQIDTLETHFTNLRDAITADLDELNHSIGDFDPTAMITRLIDDRIKPLEKLAELVGGLLPDSPETAMAAGHYRQHPQRVRKPW